MWHQQAYLKLTHPRSLSLSKEAKILRCGVKAPREGIGDHREKLPRTVCLLESNQALGPGIGSELPNFQAGDHGSTEPALRPKSRRQSLEASSAYQFLAPFPTTHHLFTGAELPLSP